MYARTLHLLMICALSLLPAVGVYAQYNYSFFPIHSAQLNPLEQRLAEADFCEITPAQLRIPNYQPSAHLPPRAAEYPLSEPPRNITHARPQLLQIAAF